MALAHSPSISTNGLQFLYDMGNPGRSWKGAPTTNLVPNPYANWNGSNFVFPIYNYDATGTQTYTYVTNVPNPIGSPGVMQYTTGTAGYKYWSIYSVAATTGTHTFSYYARIVNGPATTSNLGNSQLWRSNGVDQSVTGDWNPTYTTDWVRYSTTGPCTASTPLDYFPIHAGVIAGGYTIQYCGFQLESGTYATPFVAGTRSNTQSLLDLGGSRTITANSLTYASNNTFSFNGSTDNLTMPTISLGNGNLPWTCSAWVKTTTTVGNTLGAGPILSNQSGGPVYSAMCVNSGKIAYWTYQSGAWAQKLGVGPSVNDNVWHMLTWVNNPNNTMAMYVDGVLDSNVADSTSGNNNPIDMIGSSWAAKFAGSIGAIQIYTSSLTANQVAQNYAAYRGRYGI
jgi:hypothetical protein